MIHTDYAGAARKALLSVLGADAYTRAEALRPSADPYSDSDAVRLGEISSAAARCRCWRCPARRTARRNGSWT